LVIAENFVDVDIKIQVVVENNFLKQKIIKMLTKIKIKKLNPDAILFELPKGYEIQIRPRSGLALNHGITLSNTPGTLDSGYRGELKVGMINLSGEPYHVKKGERIAQLILAKHETAEIEQVSDLSESTRGENGFGSTGK